MCIYSSADHQRRVLSVPPIIIINNNTHTKILSMVTKSMILRCVCVFVFSDDDTNRERTS